jgi:hypothetical protein
MASIPFSPNPVAKLAHSHLFMLLAKLRTGTTGRAVTARLATVETARRANIVAVGQEWSGYMGGISGMREVLTEHR